MAVIGLGPGNVPAVVAITVVNESDYPIHVNNTGIDLQDGSNNTMSLTTPMPGASLPGTVEPHNSGVAFALKEEVERQGVDLTKPVRVWARLATGHVLRS
jgi:hypothetical protein